MKNKSLKIVVLLIIVEFTLTFEMFFSATISSTSNARLFKNSLEMNDGSIVSCGSTYSSC